MENSTIRLPSCLPTDHTHTETLERQLQRTSFRFPSDAAKHNMKACQQVKLRTRSKVFGLPCPDPSPETQAQVHLNRRESVSASRQAPPAETLTGELHSTHRASNLCSTVVWCSENFVSLLRDKTCHRLWSSPHANRSQAQATSRRLNLPLTRTRVREAVVGLPPTCSRSRHQFVQTLNQHVCLERPVLRGLEAIVHERPTRVRQKTHNP